MTKKEILLQDNDLPPWEDEDSVTQVEDHPDSMSEEEAHFFHTLIAFEELVRLYGMEQIMESVEDDIYVAMFDFFMPPEEGEEEQF